MSGRYAGAVAIAIVAMSLRFPIAAAQDVRPSEELRVLSSTVSRTGMLSVMPLCEKAAGAKVQMRVAHNPILKREIEAGAAFDVVVIEPGMLRELARGGHVSSASMAGVASSGMKLLASAGAPAIDISSVESFKKALLEAKSVGYVADGHSGEVFLQTLEKIGILEAMKPKLVPERADDPRPGTQPAPQYIAGPMAAPRPGTQIAGSFPEEVQTYVGIWAAVGSRASAPAAAAAFVGCLQSAPSLSLFKSSGYSSPVQ